MTSVSGADVRTQPAPSITDENSLVKRFSNGADYTWRSFIDGVSKIFNPAVNGDIVVAERFTREFDLPRFSMRH